MIREKDALITDNEGCWTFLNVYPNTYLMMVLGGNQMAELENKKKQIFITKVTLPSDVRAKAWGKPFSAKVRDDNVCNFTWKADIKPGQTIDFNVGGVFEGENSTTDTGVYGLKFMKA